MPLPKYTRKVSKPARERLPKGAYVIKILNAKEDEVWGKKCVSVLFDIAEGDYAGFFQKQYDADKQSREDAFWPYDGRHNLDIPNDKSEQWVWDRYNEFFTAVEDSNNGFVFDGDVKALKGKIMGGKFVIVHTKGYDNTRFRRACAADDVRSGDALKYMPKDYSDGSAAPSRKSGNDLDKFVNVTKGDEDEIPFD